MLPLDVSEVDIEKRQIESFQMIVQFFGETAGFPESPSDTMSEPAIITFYPNGSGFSDDMGIRLKGFYKTWPIICANPCAGTPGADNFFRNAIAVFKLRFPRT